MNHSATIKIALEDSGSSGQAFEQIATKAKAADESIKRLNKSGRHGASSDRRMAEEKISSRSGGSGGAAALAMAGPVGAGVAAALAAVSALKEGLEKTAKSIEIVSSSFTTNAQKVRQLTEEFAPFGSVIFKFIDAIDGVSDRMKSQALESHVSASRSIVEAGGMSRIRQAQGEYREAEYRKLANSRVGYEDWKIFDKTTVSGRQGGTERDITQGAKDQGTRAQRERLAAQDHQKHSDARLHAADARVKSAQDRVDATGRISAGLRESEDTTFIRDKPGRDKAIRDELQANLELQIAIKAREEEINRAKEAGVRLAQADSNARKASLEVAKADLQVLQQREARMSSAQTKYGFMGEGEFAAGANALKLANKFGFEKLPPELRRQAAEIAPDWANAQAEKFGGDKAERLKAIIGEDGFKQAFGQDWQKGNQLGDVRKNLDKVQANIRVQVNLDEEKLAEDILNVLQPTVGQIKANLLKEMDARDREIRNGAALITNASGI